MHSSSSSDDEERENKKGKGERRKQIYHGQTVFIIVYERAIR